MVPNTPAWHEPHTYDSISFRCHQVVASSLWGAEVTRLKTGAIFSAMREAAMATCNSMQKVSSLPAEAVTGLCGNLQWVKVCLEWSGMNLPRPVLSGLSGGSQNTTSVRKAKNIQGRVKMYDEKTTFRVMKMSKVRTTKLGSSCSEGIILLLAVTLMISQAHDSL